MSLSPLARRRLANFRANKRGYWSLWIFGAIFTLTLLSDVLANDQPLLIMYDGQWLFPIVNTYQETTFGGDFSVEADYRDPYVQDLIQQKGWMIWPLIPFSYDTIDYNVIDTVPSPPSTEHWLGTDDQGRDIVARLLYGLRLSIIFGVALTLSSSVIGVAAGAIQGYFGGWLDLVFQRLIEVWENVPVLFLIMILASVIAPSFWSLLILLLLFSWMALVRVVRAEFLRARNLDYVHAAEALGVASYAIIFRHILPNAMVATVTFMPFILNSAITTLTALDFLGFGLPIGSPSLGEMLSQGKENLYAPWIGVTVFIVLSITLTLLTFIGEAVRDAFDPRKGF